MLKAFAEPYSVFAEAPAAACAAVVVLCDPAMVRACMSRNAAPMRSAKRAALVLSQDCLQETWKKTLSSPATM